VGIRGKLVSALLILLVEDDGVRCEMKHTMLFLTYTPLPCFTAGSKRADCGLRCWSCFVHSRLRMLRDAIKDSYLVDPASSHMLVSKIKPCMSKYKLLIL
jgi:hypothetical protein